MPWTPYADWIFTAVSTTSLLLDAARSVDGLSRTSEPFVLQTSLNDFHISYELNDSVGDVNRYRQILSQLLGAIQDQFAAADREILSPGYHAIRNGNRSTVPIRTDQGLGIRSR
jgi:small-conductance mechanosensitive channel